MVERMNTMHEHVRRGVPHMTSKEKKHFSSYYLIKKMKSGLVKVHIKWNGKVLIKLFNSQGKLIYRNDVSKYQDNLKEVVEVSAFPAGIYQLWMSNGDHIITKEWVKM